VCAIDRHACIPITAPRYRDSDCQRALQAGAQNFLCVRVSGVPSLQANCAAQFKPVISQHQLASASAAVRRELAGVSTPAQSGSMGWSVVTPHSVNVWSGSSGSACSGLNLSISVSLPHNISSLTTGRPTWLHFGFLFEIICGRPNSIVCTVLKASSWFCCR